MGLRSRPQGLRFRPVGLRFRTAGLRFRSVGLRFMHLSMLSRWGVGGGGRAKAGDLTVIIVP